MSGRSGIKLLVDGGYLSFRYAATIGGYNYWLLAKRDYLKKRNVLFLMDRQPKLRQAIHPGYKAHRKKRIQEDPEALARVKRVRRMREMITEDPSIETLSFDGLEADDLVALLSPYCKEVIGVDKDLLQIRGIHLYDFHRQPILFSSFRKKVAKKLRPLLQTTNDLILAQSILGDKTDDIPRVLPPRKYDIALKLWLSERPFYAAYEEWGDPYLLALKLILLPTPELFHLSDQELLFLMEEDRKERSVEKSWWFGLPYKDQAVANYLERLTKAEEEQDDQNRD